MKSQQHAGRTGYAPRPVYANIPRPVPRPPSRWLKEPMPVDVARTLIGEAAFGEAVAAGSGHCLSRLTTSWARCDMDPIFAWRVAYDLALANEAAAGGGLQ